MGTSAAGRMNRVFADSGYWIGLRDKTDPHHERSRRLARWIVENRVSLVVTPFIFAETQGYFSRSPTLRQLVIRDFWENAVLRIEQPSHDDQEEAIKILRGQRDKSYSFADAVTFAVMGRLDLADVITYDRHFHQFGGFNIIDGEDL